MDRVMVYELLHCVAMKPRRQITFCMISLMYSVQPTQVWYPPRPTPNFTQTGVGLNPSLMDL